MFNPWCSYYHLHAPPHWSIAYASSMLYPSPQSSHNLSFSSVPVCLVPVALPLPLLCCYRPPGLHQSVLYHTQMCFSLTIKKLASSNAIDWNWVISFTPPFCIGTTTNNSCTLTMLPTLKHVGFIHSYLKVASVLMIVLNIDLRLTLSSCNLLDWSSWSIALGYLCHDTGLSPWVLSGYHKDQCLQIVKQTPQKDSSSWMWSTLLTLLSLGSAWTRKVLVVALCPLEIVVKKVHVYW